MPSNYQEITLYNEKRLGDDTSSRRSQVSMYSDSTHFIYEILQNADDYEASTVDFQLMPNQLVIEHNGIPFTTDNVKAVSYFEKGTSEGDLTKTGHFGLGFKSVFAFTASPIIHSGNEHFEIFGLYRLRPVNIPEGWENSTTRIILPFNHEEKQPDYVAADKLVSAENAFNKISKKLKQLNMTTLLFTKNIRKITWGIGVEKGHYFRNDDFHYNSNLTHRLTQISNAVGVNQRFMVFERPILWENKNYKSVEIAFKLDENGNICEFKQQLFVLFATKIDTRLGFIINGPYRTNPARETVSEEDEFNRYLIKETATLIVESFHIIKNQGFLNTNFLQVLPIVSDDFPEESLFRPIFDSVRSAFLKQPLLPTQNAVFVSSSQARLAGSKNLRNLLSSENIRILLDAPSQIHWLPEDITERGTPDLWKYLKDELKIKELTPESFANKITKKFIETQTDNWITELYSFLIDQESLWRKPSWHDPDQILRYKQPIIRLNDGNHVSPFKSVNSVESPNAYIPPSEETDFPIVKRKIVENKQALDFLKRLGLTEPDIVDEVIDKILPHYKMDDNISDESHKRDISKIFRALKTKSEEKKQRLISELKNTVFLYAVNAENGELSLKKPTEIYIQSFELKEYFSNNSSAWLLDSRYYPDIEELYSVLDIYDKPKLFHKNPNGYYITTIDDYGWHERGVNGFDPNCSIDGIEDALNFINLKKSLYIWNIVVLENLKHIKGTIESSTRQNFKGCKSEQRFSKFGNLLANNIWLPDKKGIFRKPSEITLSDLSDEFEPESIESRKLAEILGFRKDIDHELLSQLPEEKRRKFELAEQIPLDKLEEFVTFLKKPSFPEKSVSNPERRRQKIEEQAQSAIPKESEKRERNVRISETEAKESAKTSLRYLYTNDDEQMICQICEKEMPFKLPDGKYYFEAVQCVKNVLHEFDRNYLALCPVCAAKYKYAKETEDEIVKEALVKSDKMEIPVILADKPEKIRFVEQHFHDLKIVLEGENYEKEK